MNSKKLCSKCKLSFPATLDFFYKRLKNKSGLTSQCKKCIKKADRLRRPPKSGQPGPMAVKNTIVEDGLIIENSLGSFKILLDKEDRNRTAQHLWNVVHKRNKKTPRIQCRKLNGRSLMHFISNGDEGEKALFVNSEKWQDCRKENIISRSIQNSSIKQIGDKTSQITIKTINHGSHKIIFDTEDEDKVKSMRWNLDLRPKSGYRPESTKSGRIITLASLLLENKTKFRIKQINDKNWFDYRKTNLHIPGVPKIIDIDHNTTEMIIYSPKYGEKSVLIDSDDLEHVSKFNWWLNKDHSIKSKDVFYVRGRDQGKDLALHSYLMKPPDGMVVDHIDGNPLNNRRSNLRVCTPKQNSYNSTKKQSKTASSKFIGVYYRKEEKIYTVSCRRKYVGSFKTELEAAKAYDEVAKKEFGQYAKLNFK